MFLKFSLLYLLPQLHCNWRRARKVKGKIILNRLKFTSGYGLKSERNPVKADHHLDRIYDHLRQLTCNRPHELQSKALIHPIEDYPMKHFLPEKYAIFLVIPLFLEVGKVLFGWLFRLVPRRTHHSSHGTLTVLMTMSVSVIALRTVLMLVHYYML